MSAAGTVRKRVSALHIYWRGKFRNATKMIFDDEIGVVIFLIGLLVGGVFLQTRTIINDNFTLINTLVAVSEGHLNIERVVVGAPWSPGSRLVDGRVYGRNYGQVILALPFFWVLNIIGNVIDLRLGIFALITLLILSLGIRIGRIFGHESEGRITGGIIGLVIFGANTALATPLPISSIPQIALQFQTMIATGLGGVVLYRLVAAIHGRRVGGFAGLVLITATPVAYWSNVPKRHAISTLFVLFVGYTFYRSRTVESIRQERRFRAIAYAATALFAWFVAPEAGVLAIALVAVDFPTARSNDPKSLLTIGLIFSLAAVPFFLTNWLISGNPILPPRLLPRVPVPQAGTGIAEVTQAAKTVATPESRIQAGATSGTGAAEVVGRFVRSITVGFRDPNRLVHTFFRSGYIKHLGTGATNLTVLESAPILGGLFALPILAGKYIISDNNFSLSREPERTMDAFAIIATLLFTMLYLPSLPVFVQFTVRYLLPLYALGLYGVVRLAPVRRVIRKGATIITWTTAGTVLIGSQLIIIWLGVTSGDLTRGTALQFHALLDITASVLLGGYVVAASFTRERPSDWNIQIGAVVLGLAVGGGAVLVIFSSLLYFTDSELLALPLLRHLAALLEAI